MLLPNAYVEPRTPHIMTILGDKVFKEVINLIFGISLDSSLLTCVFLLLLSLFSRV